MERRLWKVAVLAAVLSLHHAVSAVAVSNGDQVELLDMGYFEQPRGLGEQRGGQNTALKGAAETKVFAAQTRKLEEQLNEKAKESAKAAQLAAEVQKADAAKVQNLQFQAKSLQANETVAEKVALQSEKNKDKANQEKIEAQAHLQAAIAEVKATAAEDNAAQKGLANAKRSQQITKETLVETKALIMAQKSNMTESLKRFLQAKEAYVHANHRLATLTGLTKQGENAEAFHQRTASDAMKKTLSALTGLDHAMVTAAQASAKQQNAEKAVQMEQEKKDRLQKAASVAEDHAAKLKVALAEAKKDGSATEEMLKAAHEASDTAERSTDLLRENAQELIKLDARKKQKEGVYEEAEKKANVLEKIKKAEESLLQQSANKTKQAEEEESRAKNALNAQVKEVHDASLKAKTLVRAASNLNTTLKGKVNELNEEKAVVEKQAAVISTERHEREKLAKEQEEASHISIPPMTDYDTASKVLSQKQSDLKKVMNPMLNTIKTEKEATSKEKEAEKQVTTLAVEVKDDQKSTERAKDGALSAEKKEKRATEKLDIVHLRSQVSSQAVKDDKDNEEKALRKVQAIALKAQNIKKTVALDAEEQGHLKEKAQAAVRSLEQLETETAEKDGEKISELKAVQRIVAEKPSPVPVDAVSNATKAVVAKLLAAPTPAPAVPTSAPTSLVQKLMAVKKSSHCKDHSEWLAICPYKHDHCNDFMAMKVF